MLIFKEQLQNVFLPDQTILYSGDEFLPMYGNEGEFFLAVLFTKCLTPNALISSVVNLC